MDPNTLPIFTNHRKEHVYDDLTGLVNREYIIKYAQSLIDSGILFGFFLVDIDNFKKINDAEGHMLGDQVLKDCAKILKDNIGDRGVVARYTGDELAIIIPNIAMYDDVWNIARKYSQAIRKATFPYLVNTKQENTVTVTSGISRYPIDGHSVQELINLADKALYRGKTKGKNCFIIFNKALHGSIDPKARHAKLTVPGLINYCFSMFMKEEPLEAFSKVTHLVGNYYSDTRFLLWHHRKIYTGYDSMNYDVKEYDYPEDLPDIEFTDNETYRVFYRSIVKRNPDLTRLYNIMKAQNIGTLIVFKTKVENNAPAAIIIVAQEEKIWADGEIIVYQTIANLVAFANHSSIIS